MLYNSNKDNNIELFNNLNNNVIKTNDLNKEIYQSLIEYEKNPKIIFLKLKQKGIPITQYDIEILKSKYGL